MIYGKLKEQGFQQQLARVFSSPQSVGRIYDEADLPAYNLPGLISGTPMDHWISVTQHLDAGAVENGLERLVRAAQKLFPGNEVFRNCLQLVEQSTGFRSQALEVLFLASNPFKTDFADLGVAMRAVTHGLSRASNIDFVPKTAVRIGELLDLITQEAPDVLHFAGHGSPQGGLHLEDGRNHHRELLPETLAKLIHSHNLGCPRPIRLVVLNLCSSCKIAEYLTMVPAIGFHGEIEEQAAASFARGFYHGLAKRKDLQTAWELGRTQMELDGGAGCNVRLHMPPGMKPCETFL